MLQLFNKLSLAFGHLIRFLLLSIFFMFTAVVAVSSYLFLVSAPFEYSYGQDDLSLADLIVLALLAMATWRYFRRGKQSQTTPWSLLKRFAFTLTFVTLLLLSALGVLASIASVEPELAGEQFAPGAGDLLVYGIFCVFIVAIYGAAPLPALFSQTVVRQESSSGQRDEQNESHHSEPEPPTLNPSTENKF